MIAGIFQAWTLLGMATKPSFDLETYLTSYTPSLLSEPDWSAVRAGALDAARAVGPTGHENAKTLVTALVRFLAVLPGGGET